MADKPLVLEVGGLYRNGQGDLVEIVSKEIVDDVVHFVDHEKWHYNSAGRWSFDGSDSTLDLVEQIDNPVSNRLQINRRQVINDLGHMAAKSGMYIAAIKMYRAIYGVGLLQAKQTIEAARDHARRSYDCSNPLEPRMKQLEECLAETRHLVGVAASSGFTDDASTTALFVNNGAITRLVPSTIESRRRMTEATVPIMSDFGEKA